MMQAPWTRPTRQQEDPVSNEEAAKPAAKGMAGMVVADSNVSFVDGTNGILEYRGYDIRVLAEHSTYEEVAYLLWNGHLPTAHELADMKRKARACRFMPPEIIAALRSLPKNAEPMAVMRTAVSMLAHYDPESEENTPIAHQHKACRLLGQLSGVLAAFERIRRGEEPVKPRTDLDHAANFLWMLTGEDPDRLAAKALDQYLLLLAEHELNASTFTARVIASTGSDLHSAITGAMGALKGPAHGAAVQEAMEQFLEIGSVDNVVPWFESRQGTSRRVMGIGHRVYKVRDPRAAPLMANVEKMVEATGERIGLTSLASWKRPPWRTVLPGAQPERQRRLLLRAAALLARHPGGHLHLHVRHEPHRRLDGPRLRAAVR